MAWRENDPDIEHAVYPRRLLAAFMFLIAIWSLYARFSGEGTPDWLGYSGLYDSAGGYLETQGRDPLFVWLIAAGRRVLGPNGYPDFRLLVFGLLSMFGSRLVYSMPCRRIWPWLSALTVLDLFLLKGLVQIREGLAIALVSAPLVGAFTTGRISRFQIGVFAAIASLIHIGAACFLFVWLCATLFPARSSTSNPLPNQGWLLSAGTVLGVGLGVLILKNPEFVEKLLRDIAENPGRDVNGGLFKNLYWIANGAMLLEIRKQVSIPNSEFGGIARDYSAILGSVLMPALYFICIILVFDQFFIPGVTSMFVRLFLTSMQLALVIIGLRGTGNWVTLLLVVVNGVDQWRLLA